MTQNAAARSTKRGRRPLHGESMISVTCDVPRAVHDRARELAKRTDRTMAFVIREALSGYLDIAESNDVQPMIEPTGI